MTIAPIITTPDERALRAAAHTSSHARLLLADHLQEMGREREACVERIVAQPESDVWRLQWADWLERNGQAEYAEFVRLDIATDGVPTQRSPEMSYREWEKLAKKRDSLLDRSEDVFRRGPACEACGGRGCFTGEDETRREFCTDCNATGDGGGLWECVQIEGERDDWKHVINWRRGCPERVECKFDEAFHQMWTTCKRCEGRGAVAWNHGATNCPECSKGSNTGKALAWQPTDRAKRVCRWHPVLELLPSDKDPSGNKGWARDDVQRTDPNVGHFKREVLPRFVWDELSGEFELKTGPTVTDGPNWKFYQNREAAMTALATALARLARKEAE